MPQKNNAMDITQPKLKTLEQVNEALEAVEKARGKKGLSASDKMSLQQSALTLRDIERSLEKTIQEGLVDALTTDCTKLNELIDDINAASKKLDKLAVILKKTADVVGALVKIVATAVGAGFI
jgi:hypothetical protein